MAKKTPATPAKKAPAKRKPRPKNPVADTSTEFGRITSEDLQRAIESLKKSAGTIVDPTDYGEPVKFPSWLTGGIKAIVLLTIGVLGGIYAAGGIEIGGDVRPGPVDAVSAVFDTQEAAFRKWSGERDKALIAGEIKSEAESAKWMDARFGPDSEAAWIPLLTAEAAAFGGEQWTAEKEAAHIREYAR
jgi:hypothetical protein